MTGLYVICSRAPQKHLSARRNGYQEYLLGKTHAYLREAVAPDDLGLREGAHIRILPQWLQDIASVRADPEATFFYLELRHRETIGEAVTRGLALPRVQDVSPLLRPDQERRAIPVRDGLRG